MYIAALPILQKPVGAGNVAARIFTIGSPTPPNPTNFSHPRAVARGTELWVVAAGLGIKGTKGRHLKFHTPGLVAKDTVIYVLT